MSKTDHCDDISYHNLFKTMTHGVVYQNAKGEIISANPAAERILGLSFDQITGRTSMDPCWKAIREDGSDFPGEVHPAMVALKTGETVKNVLMGVFHPAKGAYRWLKICAVPEYREGERKPYRVYTTFEDITNNKRAEKALKESETRFRGLVEVSSDWIWEVNIEGVYTYASPRVEEILGYKPEEVLGKTPFDLMPLSEAKRIAMLFRAFVEAGEPIITLENVCLHKDGRPITLETSGVPVTDAAGKVTGYRGMDRDITERKRAEVALQESAIKHRALIKNIPGMVYRAYPDWSAEVISGSADISNYTTTEINSKKINWLSIIHPDDKKQVFREGSVLAMEPAELIQAYRIIAKGGDIRWVEDHKVSLFSKEGDFLGIDGIVFDITEQKKREAQLMQAHKMDAIGTLAGGIAHEFNNALTGMTGSLELLEIDFPSDTKVAQHSTRMKASVQRMLQLTTQLLTYARGGKYQTETVSLGDFVREAMPLFKHITDFSIDVDTDQPRDILNVKIDPAQMQMVLSALLINASEAMQDHGSIHIGYQKVAMVEGTSQDFPGLKPGDYACLEVTDDGKGMDEETRTRIFEPFFSTKFQGRGLGMASVYGIVKNHDGWISVDSVEGKGTAVKIYLPIEETSAPKRCD